MEKQQRGSGTRCARFRLIRVVEDVGGPRGPVQEDLLSVLKHSSGRSFLPICLPQIQHI